MNALISPGFSTDVVAQIEYQEPSPGQGSVSSTTYFFFEEEIPASFFAGLEDVNAGRVVDMERALNEQPPTHA
jgi:hypothetical protein